MSGVTALTVSTIIVKIIGLVYKIPLMHYLGAEGMGYFNSAYELYTLFFVIATAGLPVAVSIMISENLANGKVRNAKKIYKLSFSVFLALGMAGAIVLLVCSRSFAEAIGNPRAWLCIACIAPTVFFISVASAIRGYFQGNQDMIPTAVSQVIEAGGKLLLGLLLAVWAVRAGLEMERAAALSVLGIVAGSAISMLYLLVYNAVKKTGVPCLSRQTEPTRRILRHLLSLAIPVTVSTSLSSLTRVADMTLIMNRLAVCGVEESSAVAMYGSYSTMAIPVYHLPSSLLLGIAVSLVPTLAAAIERGDKRGEAEIIQSSFRLCAFVAVPCAVGLAVLSRPILDLLFLGEAEAIAVSAPLLAALGFSVPSACLLAVTSSVLQAHKKVFLPIVSMLVGLLVKIILGYWLIGLPAVGMMGAPVSTLICNLVSVGMNLYFMETCGAYMENLFSVLAKPLVSSVVAMVVALAVCYPLWESISAMLVSLLVALVFGGVYLGISLKFGVLEQKDMTWITEKKKRSVT